MTTHIPVNDKGIKIGQYHHRATVDDETVGLMRDLHEVRGLSYGQLALKFKRPYHYVKKICRYERRNQIIADWR